MNTFMKGVDVLSRRQDEDFYRTTDLCPEMRQNRQVYSAYVCVCVQGKCVCAC